MRKYTAGINDNEVRLNRFCEKVCPYISKGVLYKSFRNKRIKVNGKRQDPDYRIKENDLIELYINDEFFADYDDKKNVVQFKCQNAVQLNIIYQDDNIIFIDKPSGLLCHSDNKYEPNLVDSLLAYLTDTESFDSVNENTFTPALCNRIDQGTQGIVIAAKNYKSLAEMNKLIRENFVVKQYLCVTQKPVKTDIYTAFITHDTTDKKATVTNYETLNSKNIITEFKTLKSNSKASLIECTLFTGRTHQIRAHLSFLGSPIIGDVKYGGIASSAKTQLLSAYKITFKDIDASSHLMYLSNQTFSCKSSPVIDFYNRLEN